MRPSMWVILFFAAVVSVGGTCRAEIGLISLTTERGEVVRAVLGVPDAGSGKRTAVIFNHGTDVRRDGYEGAKRGGSMDVDDYVKPLVQRGYVVVAPLRTLLAREATLDRGKLVGTPEQWDAVLDYGHRAIAAARKYLDGRADVDTSSIVMMGYSEGGNLALWSAIGNPTYRAVVLVAPAAMPTSTRYQLRMAANPENLRRIGVPVFLAVATRDFDGIRGVTTEKLIPNMQEIDPRFRFRTDYPGDHNRFFKIDRDLWADLTAFFQENGL